MAEHHFDPTVYYTAIGSHEPVLRIQDGDTVTTSTLDSRGGDRTNTNRAPRPNPVTGPFYLEGAEPGDSIELVFESIVPNRKLGRTANVLADHVVDPGFVKELPAREILEWEVDLDAWEARMVDPLPVLGRWTLPLEPFLGCFGVAPAQGQAISTATSGPHGGNMDYRGFQTGVSIFLPVFVEGALLQIGDGHGFQGDGEIVGTGLEISMDVRFRMKLRKNRTIHWPRGESDTHLFTVGNARPLDQALQHANTEMLRWLKEDYGLDAMEASVLLGQCVEYEIGNVFNPAYTVVCNIHKKFLPAK